MIELQEKTFPLPQRPQPAPKPPRKNALERPWTTQTMRVHVKEVSLGSSTQIQKKKNILNLNCCVGCFEKTTNYLNFNQSYCLYSNTGVSLSFG
jgi:hypothetical protein